MCGITGILNFDFTPASDRILQKMTAAIAHRGPDGEGFSYDREIGFGHRRLAIVDLSSAGNQPMHTKDRKFFITYNGELYNYLPIRAELEDLGYEFATRTDTEVLLYALVHWGVDAIPKLNGMFAFAFWDADRRELLVARDRFGVKPLYYSNTGASFIFASEIKALLEHPNLSARLDKAALLEYMTFQNLFTDFTLFEGVRILPAGCFLIVNSKSNRVSEPNKYWDFNLAEPSCVVDENEALEELDFLFCKAVKLQLMGDVPVGSYLSGGMDSGSITAIAAKELSHMTTFTCGFDLKSASGLELNFDERQRAEYMSYLFRTEHYEMVLKAGDMERAFSKVVFHIEEPRVGQSYPNYYISRLASKFCKVVLSGTGGDELFGGYPWRYYRAAINSDFDQYVDKYYSYWQRLVSPALAPKLFAPIWNDVKNVNTRDIFCGVFARHDDQINTPEQYIKHSLYFELKTFLHGLLIVEDKLSMANGLESRVPFLDNDLVDFASKLPVKLMLGNLNEVIQINENLPGKKTAMYFNKTSDGKLLLRRMMERYIPKSVTEQEKQGFSAPDASWFRGESIEYVKRKILTPKARIYDFFDPGVVQSLVGEHIAGKENRRLLIWSLLYLENWIEQFLE